MRYEEILRQTSGCGIFRVAFLLLAASSPIRVGTSINIVIFQLTTPTLTCIGPNSTIDNVSYEIKTPGWCRAEDSDLECDRWTYSSENQQSVLQEWNLCTDRMKVLLIQTIFIIGFGTGSYATAFMSDKFGRIRLSLILSVLDCVNLVAIAFSVNFWMFLMCSFVSQFINGGIVVTFYTYMNELFHPRHRRYFEFYAFTMCGFSLGVLALCAFLTTSWRHLELVQIIFCGTNAMLMLLILPESPKWLLVTNRPKAAKKALMKLASHRKNCKPPEAFFSDIEIAKEVRAANLCALGSSRQLLINTIVSTIVLAIAVLIYYVITWNSESFLTGNIYMNTFIMGLTEIPNTILYLLLANRVSKKKMLMVSLITCGSTLIVGSCTKQYLPAMPAIFNSFTFAARMAANFAHTLMFSFIPEVFPTSLRSNGFGFASFGSRMLSAPMPYILLTAGRNDVLIPSLIMAAAIIASSFSLILLPDTYRCRLPDTMEESRLFKRGSEHLFRIDQEKCNSGNETEKEQLPCSTVC